MKSGAGETFTNRIVWQSCYNNSGQAIPPFSVVMTTGWNLPDMSGFQTDSPYLNVKQPDGTGAPYNHFITWEVEIPANSFGACARPDQTPLIALLAGGQSDSSDAPFRLCGPQPGQWTLSRDAPGFVMLSPPQNGYALVVPSRGPYIGQLTAAASQGGAATLTMMSGAKGRETAGSLTINAYDRFAAIAQGAQCLFDWAQNGWEIIAAEC